MFQTKKNFVVMLGDSGVVITLHSKNKLESKLFIDEFNEDVKIDVKNLFYKNSTIPISIIIDSIDQIYKKKIYPPLKKSDLEKLIKRDIASDSDKESFKNFIIHSCKNLLNSKKNHIQKSEAILISSSASIEIRNWIDFLVEMPNEIKGIFLSPIESFSLVKKFKNNQSNNKKNNSSAKSNLKNSNKKLDEEKINFLITHNKICGTRQTIFNNHGIIFTRLINYNFDSEEFIYKFEQDIFSTFEYLKRLIPDLRISDTDITTVLPENAFKKIEKIQNIDIKISNFTPNLFAEKIGYQKFITDNSKFCDVLLSAIFLSSKKILKFSTPKITILDNFFLAIKSSYAFNSLASLLLVIYFFKSFFFESEAAEKLRLAEENRLNSMKMMSSVKLPSRDSDNQLTENGNLVTIEEIIDFGKTHEILSNKENKFSDQYYQLKYLKKHSVMINNFSYNLTSFVDNSPKIDENYQIILKGNFSNQSGDIEDLFKGFDKLTNSTKKNFEGYLVKYNDIPRNIDFVKKYYSFPIEFTLTK